MTGEDDKAAQPEEVAEVAEKKKKKKRKKNKNKDGDSEFESLDLV